MISIEEHVKNFDNEWPERDLIYLDELISGSDCNTLLYIIPQENWFLWHEKIKLEELLLSNLLDLEINNKIYAFDVAICRRISVLKAIYSLGGRSLFNLSHAFRLFSPEIMIYELIKPIDSSVLEKLGKTPETFGNGHISSNAREPGEMFCISVNEHDEALYHWLKAKNDGLLSSGHILLHFDAHSDMFRISEKDMEILRNIKDLDDFKKYIATFYFREPGDNLATPINLASFIHYGVEMGLVREVFWIYPTPDYCKYRFPANLDMSFLLSIDGGTDFRLRDGHIICDWAGITVHILTINDLPVFNEEVILDIDIDFFINQDFLDESSGSRGYRINDKEKLLSWKNITGRPLKTGDVVPWITPDEFSSILKTKNIHSLLTTLALSPFFTPGEYHFLIDKIKL